MIVVHIGLKKSGSSTLQKFLSQNRKLLLDFSIDYSRVGLSENNHQNIAYEISSPNKFDKELGGVKRLSRHLSSDYQHQTTILSSEVFEGFDLRAIQKLRKFLVKARPEGDFKIVLIVRDLIDLMPSSYAQKIKYGSHSYDFDTFYNHRIREERVNYYQTTNKWATVFGWDSIQIRLLDAKYLFNGDLIDDFLQMLGVDLDDPRVVLMNRLGIRNARPGWKVLEATRALYNNRHGLKSDHPLLRAVEKEGRNKPLGLVALQLGEELGWNEDKGHYLTRDQARECLGIYRDAVVALNLKLPDCLPNPISLKKRGFVERVLLPDVELIPRQNLNDYYDRLGTRWLQSQH